MKNKKPIEVRKKLPDSTLNKILIGIICILPFIYFAPLLSGSKMMAGSDWLLAGYYYRNWLADCFKLYHSIPLWDPMVFCGLPSGNSYSLYNFWFTIFPTHIAWTYGFVLGTILSGLGIYFYLKELKVSLYSAFLGALIYMGAGSVLSMTSPGHDGKLFATALVPFIILFLHKGLVYRSFFNFLFAGTVAGIAAVNAHFQLIYYAGVVCVFYFLFHLIWHRKENKTKGTLKLIFYAFCALILTVGLLAMHYLPTFAGLGWGARGGERGYKFATSWALPVAELIDLLTPHFSGILDNYWGENYFKLDTQYLGILPLILALVAIGFKIRERYVKFFIGLIIVTIIFAFGGHTPLYHIPYWILPGLKKFRAPSMSFYLVAFGIAVLAGIGIQALIETKNEKLKNKNLKSMGVFLGIIFAVFAVFAIICSAGKESILASLKSHWEPIFQGDYGPQLAQNKLQVLYKNYPNFLEGLGRTAFLLAINCILIFLLYIRKLKLLPWTVIAAAILLFDQWSIEKNFLKTVPPPSEYYAADDIVNSYPTTLNPESRIFPLIYEHSTDAYLSIHNIQSVGGYVSNPGKRYQELIGAGEQVMFVPPNLVRYKNLLNILNVKYIASVWLPEDLSKYPEETKQMIDNFRLGFFRQWGIEFEAFHKGFTPIYKTQDGRALYSNDSAMSRAWIAHKFEVQPTNSVLERLKQPDFDPRTTVILEEQPSIQNSELSIQNSETVEITEYSPNKILCTANLEAPGFLVLSENWHPDWKVYVDGKREKNYVADYTLRAVQLDKGEHKIEFDYAPFYFKLGALISLIAVLAVIGIIVLYIMSKFRKRIMS